MPAKAKDYWFYVIVHECLWGVQVAFPWHANMWLVLNWMDYMLIVSLVFYLVQLQVSANSNGDRPSDSATAGGDAKVTNDDDDDELDIDELNELEASLSKVTIQEPGTAT